MHLNSVDDVYNSQTDAPIYQALNCTSNAEKMMCFLLNERTRELCGEGYRWEDLARTKTLDARWHAFNDGVSRGIGEFDPAIHYYRPIPQSYLDGVTNNSGAALTNEEKTSFAKPWILIVLSIKYQEAVSKRQPLFFCTNLQQHVQSSIPEKSSFPVLCKINIFPIRL